MLLTQCAACAKPLADDAPRCVRCWTRYCDASCQLEHWSNGHKKQCKKIARGGGAEQFYADAKAKEAAEAAVASRHAANRPSIPADATCYLCHEAGPEDIVHACDCHGADGLAHVSCLARVARLAAEDEISEERHGFSRWIKCIHCGGRFRGDVFHAMANAAWNTYVNEPETDENRCRALEMMANSVREGGDAERALRMLQDYQKVLRLVQPAEHPLCVSAQMNEAICLHDLGREDETVPLPFLGDKWGPDSEARLDEHAKAAMRYAKGGLYRAALELSREKLPRARRALGRNHHVTLLFVEALCAALANNPARSIEDVREAEARLADLLERRMSAYGERHEGTQWAQESLVNIRADLRNARG